MRSSIVYIVIDCCDPYRETSVCSASDMLLFMMKPEGHWMDIRRGSTYVIVQIHI